MKQSVIILLFFFLLCLNVYSQYQHYFDQGSLRIDFVLSGGAADTHVSLYELKKEPHFGGSLQKTIDPFDYGQFRVVVKDVASNIVIFTRGFCTLFEEWQTSQEAEVLEKSFFNTLTIPCPKNNILLSIEQRDRNGAFVKLFSGEFNPQDYSVSKSQLKHVDTHKLIDNGSTDACVDIVFVGDGYTKREMKKFHRDVRKMSDYLLTQGPFHKYQKKFNIWVVDAISEESGVSDPRKDIWKDTALKSSFNTLNSDRYLASTSVFIIRDYAALVPYDQICVIANTDKYGGGGIFNHFSLSSVDNERSLTVFVHEFGHAFAGLGDEYYTSDVSYSDYFNQSIEPWQPNLTTLIDFDGKWKDMVDKNIPVPTPAEERYFNQVGVFEGGGYVAKGVYRPAYDCRMKSNEAPEFCAVCQRAIEKMILFLTD
ncbi:M64 family metallopeptidase [Saccharicrinis fermentans]|uniref:IgA peptidase M64 n=1 Tax=Saccharicrinis fermentans DSM 9555 = JCM 21142 TaxID=869213 RepID=W7Y3A9_9BACT|nr:M64 family metallopeptidase [Saccharicrinis fermentans]GAF02497.1 IgA peptidase M64 [Saccharicrinis fermentans DSM 9555 = JCM 21142]